MADSDKARTSQQAKLTTKCPASCGGAISNQRGEPQVEPKRCHGCFQNRNLLLTLERSLVSVAVREQC